MISSASFSLGFRSIVIIHALFIRSLVLVAEIVKSFYPKLVDLHNYSAANGIAQKVYNWETLNSTYCIKAMVTIVC